MGDEPCDTAGNDVSEGLPDAAAALEAAAVGVPLTLAPLLPDAEADAPWEGEAAAVPDGVAADAGERATPVAEGEAAAETAGSTDARFEGDAEGVATALPDRVPLPVAVRVAEAVRVSDPVCEGDALRVADPVTVRVPLAEAAVLGEREGVLACEGSTLEVRVPLGVGRLLSEADGVTEEEGVGAAVAAGSAAPPSVNVHGTGSLSTSFTPHVPVRAALVFVARRHAAKPLPYTRRQYLTTDGTVEPAGAAAPNVSSQ
jgi:hypothetical protein